MFATDIPFRYDAQQILCCPFVEDEYIRYWHVYISELILGISLQYSKECVCFVGIRPLNRSLMFDSSKKPLIDVLYMYLYVYVFVPCNILLLYNSLAF